MAQQEGQYPGSLWMPHSNFWPGRGGHQLRYIIVHGTATPGIATAQGIGKLFQSRHDGTHGGTHYIVGKDGQVVQGVKEEDAAWGNGVVTAGHDDWWGTRGNPNLETVSIEHVKVTSDNSDALTDAQMQASFALIEYLCNKWGIPKRWADSLGGITGHFSIDPVNRKYCPGLYPWDELFQALTAVKGAPGLPATRTAAYVLRQDGINPTPASTSSSSSANLAGGGPGIVSSAGTQAHQALVELPGFAGIATAINQAEQFSAPSSISGPGDIFAWIGANGFAVLVRALFILAGVVLALGLLIGLVRANGWLSEAGGDVLPLAMQGMHPIKPQGGGA